MTGSLAWVLKVPYQRPIGRPAEFASEDADTLAAEANAMVPGTFIAWSTGPPVATVALHSPVSIALQIFDAQDGHVMMSP